MNIISFSLWNFNNLYKKHVEQNLEAASIIYKNWKCAIIIDETVPKFFIKDMLSKYNNVIFKFSPLWISESKWEYLFHRFCVEEIFNDINIERFIVRDLDSRLNWKEKYAVEEWIISGKDFHVMRDNKAHSIPILGGMWGCKSNLLGNLSNSIKKYLSNKIIVKGMDQDYLKDIIWPLVKDSTITHDSFYDGFGEKEKRNFPDSPIPFGGFVGYDVKENEINEYKIEEEYCTDMK